MKLLLIVDIYFRVSASADATVATWGESTADNLENIFEDEDGQSGDEDDGMNLCGFLDNVLLWITLPVFYMDW